MRRLAPAFLASIVLLLWAVPSAMGGAVKSSPGSFSLGVAAGDVTSNSGIVWAHPDQAGTVLLEVATDQSFTRLVHRSVLTASSDNDFTVQRAIADLSPNTRYWYRFREAFFPGNSGHRFENDPDKNIGHIAGFGASSAVGTFLTAPARSSDATIRFGWTGDYDAETLAGQTQPFWNNFDVFRSMQTENNAFNIALGDTIYSDSEVPGKLLPAALTVEQKWGKYRMNLSQKKLSDLRGAAGFYSQWDDHEFINDFSRFENLFSDGSTQFPINGQVLYDRSAKAFRDFAPVTIDSQDGLYRTERWGRNLELFFPDERSFRSAKASANHVCDNPQTGRPDLAPTAPQSTRNLFALLAPSLAQPVSPACLAAINDPNRTMLGAHQEQRFFNDVTHSDARFKVIVNELPIQQYYADPYDRWEGYEADRQRVLHALQGVKNVVILSTDVHANLVNDARFKTLEPGGPQNSGITELTTGPAATKTYNREISETVGNPAAGSLVDNVFFEPQPPQGMGMRCSGIDQFSYGEVTVTNSLLTIQPKDINGAPLVTDDGPCGPFLFAFQP